MEDEGQREFNDLEDGHGEEEVVEEESIVAEESVSEGEDEQQAPQYMTQEMFDSAMNSYSQSINQSLQQALSQQNQHFMSLFGQRARQGQQQPKQLENPVGDPYSWVEQGGSPELHKRWTEFHNRYQQDQQRMMNLIKRQQEQYRTDRQADEVYKEMTRRSNATIEKYPQLFNTDSRKRLLGRIMRGQLYERSMLDDVDGEAAAAEIVSMIEEQKKEFLKAKQKEAAKNVAPKVKGSPTVGSKKIPTKAKDFEGGISAALDAIGEEFGDSFGT